MVVAMGYFVVVVAAIGLVVVVASCLVVVVASCLVVVAASCLVVVEEFLVAATRADEVLLEPIELEVGEELQGGPMGCFVEVQAEAEAEDVVAG